MTEEKRPATSVAASKLTLTRSGLPITSSGSAAGSEDTTSATERKLRKLFIAEDSVARQLEGIRAAIRMNGRVYSREQGYMVPLSMENLRRKING